MNDPEKHRPKKPPVTVISRDMMSEIDKVNARLSFFERLARQYNLLDVLMSINNPRRLLWLNFIAGVARGLGLTVGTAIILGILFFILKSFVSLPIIGEYIGDLIDFIEDHRAGDLPV